MIIPAPATASTASAWPLSSTLPPMGALKTAPGSARAFVKDALAFWGLTAVADEAEAVTGELVANAVNASRTPAGSLVYINGHMPTVRVCLMSDGVQVVIEVHDEALGQPELRNAGADAENGRGLVMVHALTGGRWGWELKKGRHGKVVWAVLAMGAM